MFEVKIEGVEELLAKLNQYDTQITTLRRKMPEELENWQREDMRRKYPNMQTEMVANETSATTLIWPRSRQPSKDTHHRRQGPKQYRPAKRGPVVRSNRPILRAELLRQLWDRMVRLTAEAMKWP
ncbi:hypothetical protein BRDID11004_60070 [Bradyrhizobium diazoefficiens]|uniref:Uncharacterized protein n=1 Tax=Bradyrhizobium diazoefficiens TaxID=1355477 RepID=A0A810A159_9BRAD|nr:hypothetical protein [Bradyrhizobium diazoefficiens]BBZ93094.1 hypothetical protein F07S3_29270 [Bradyrhizobium diazoefficiens]BCA10845.1 hypothetical protein BDHF08_26920 [Bradyrhizobium diazoefficiens]BCE55181.1 hypothetical protein XF5B_26930 [Bradyrhizobium diazoefficiens]BCE63914.1 hypothetical protein XF6B_27130 [Bradyrhizobium diazoefficiens]